MQTTKRNLLLLSLAVGACAASACGGSSALTTTAPPDQRLSALTGATLATFCQDVSSYVTAWSARSDVQQGACRYASALRAEVSGAASNDQLQGDCARRYSSCIEVGASSLAVPPRCAFPETCTATVQQYTDCLNDVTAALDQVAASAPACGDLDVSDGVPLPVFTLPDSCRTYNALCPASPIGPTGGAAAGLFELRT